MSRQESLPDKLSHYRQQLSNRFDVDGVLPIFRRTARRLFGESDQTRKQREKEKVTTMLSEGKQSYLRILGHGMIPQFVRDRLTPLVMDAEVISDEEFNALGAAVIDTIAPAEAYNAEGVLNRKFGAGTYIYPTLEHPQGKIYFKFSSLLAYPANEDIIPLFGEELGHALTVEQRPTALTQMRKLTHVLPSEAPTQEELLALMTEKRKEKTGKTQPVEAREIRVQPRGFADTFVTTTDNVQYSPISQLLLEETRAAIIETVFLAIFNGMRVNAEVTRQGKTPLTPSLEFLLGMSGNQIGGLFRDPELLRREAVSATFVMNFITPLETVLMAQLLGTPVIDGTSINPEKMASGLELLFKELSRKSFNGFMGSLRPEQRDLFKKVGNIVGGEYLREALKAYYG